MQIDKIQNILIQSLRDNISQKDGNPQSSAITEQNTPIDANYAQYTAQVSDSGAADDAQKIQEARKLLASGALDTPEAARKAAQNILKFGV
jgi:hypothetical protein